MKVLILAGGLGTRLAEETDARPKPMVEIGGKPILWRIMKMYSRCGFNDFVILTGYKSHIIKEFFVSYAYRYSDITVDMRAKSFGRLGLTLKYLNRILTCLIKYQYHFIGRNLSGLPKSVGNINNGFKQ